VDFVESEEFGQNLAALSEMTKSAFGSISHYQFTAASHFSRRSE
jgi:hypothetical protein